MTTRIVVCVACIALGYAMVATAQHFWPVWTMAVWPVVWRVSLLIGVAVYVVLKALDISLARVERFQQTLGADCTDRCCAEVDR